MIQLVFHYVNHDNLSLLDLPIEACWKKECKVSSENLKKKKYIFL